MKIVVFDVPAESGGALTILKQYHERAISDKENTWIFVISTPNLNETENVKVLKFPWVKKSWFHRLYFDKFVAHKIVVKYNADEVLSLQNVIVKKVKVKQTLYLHQPLPFIEKKYSITENFKFWLYQNVINKIIFRSIRLADKVVVQTQWMKNACLQKVKVSPNKFDLIQPEIHMKIKSHYKQENTQRKLFFYPASELKYKNHQVIVEAVKKLKDKNIKNYDIIFTLKGNENRNVKTLYKIVEKYNLSIKFIGKISAKEVYEYYSKSILIFPSYIETFGLPMLEAKMHGSPILASDCAFSHEILDEYEDVKFFDPFNSDQLAKLIESKVLIND
jgi:glycosyltransferase involved in cell wall biosynthesis